MDNAQRTVSLSRGKGKGLVRSTLPAFLLSLLFSILLLLLAALLLSYTADPAKWIRIAGPILPALCAFVGGLISGRRENNMGALAGLLTGLMLLAVLLLAATLLGDGTTALTRRLISYAILLLLSVSGGMLGSRGGKRRAYPHRRRR